MPGASSGYLVSKLSDSGYYVAGSPVLSRSLVSPAPDPSSTTKIWHYVDSPYLAKVLAAPASPGLAAGSYKAYENAHRQRLVEIFAPKFPHLPADMLGRVLEFAFDVGGH